MSITLVVIFLFCSVKTFAISDSIVPLKKGAQIPDVKFTATFKKKEFSTTLKSYKGKWILLDFWGSYCADCIAGLPKMLELQERFKDKLKIIVVTEEENKIVQRFWKRFSDKPYAAAWIHAGENLPFITSDSILCKLFPHTGLPTHVWIDTNFILRSIAYSSTTTADNIQRLIEQKPVYLQEQEPVEVNIQHPLTWFNQQNGISGKLQYFSLLSKRIDIGHFSPLREPLVDSLNHNKIGYACLNNSIIDLYLVAFRSWRMAAGLDEYEAKSRTYIESANKRKFQPLAGENPLLWSDSNTYCYAVKTPFADEIKLEKYMRKNLDEYFDIDSRIEKRNTLCLILQSDQSHKKSLPLSTQKFAKIITEKKGTWLVIQNAPVSTLYRYLKNAFAALEISLPFFDETGYNDNISIKLPWNIDPQSVSIAAVKNALSQYGFQLTEDYRNIDMLILSDR